MDYARDFTVFFDHKDDAYAKIAAKESQTVGQVMQ
jgi:hypothetical protein